MEMKVILAVLMQNYEMELLDVVRPIAGAGTYWPAQPCRVRYRKRARSSEGGASVAELAKASGCPVNH